MEKWDLYDASRRDLNRTHIRGEQIPEGCFRLVVHVCIFNAKGQMLIQKRQKNKSGWPDLWDLSVGGHVQSGETTQMAAERETLEELGLEIHLQGQRPAVTPTFPNGFDDMYTLVQEVDIEDLVLQTEEVQEVRWASLEEVMELIDTKKFIPYHKSLIELLFFLSTNSEAHTE